ncbi:MAG: hypothetical protein MSS51_02630 [Bacteroidales bacterium]|nr:hypothetical protein [Bacteroidales bacterium]
MTPCGGRACGKDGALGIAEEGCRQCRTATARVFQQTNDKISMFRIDFSARISTGENETEPMKIKEQREQLNRQTNQLNLQSERLNLQSEQLDCLKRILKEQGFSDADIQRMMSNK